MKRFWLTAAMVLSLADASFSAGAAPWLAVFKPASEALTAYCRDLPATPIGMALVSMMPELRAWERLDPANELDRYLLGAAAEHWPETLEADFRDLIAGEGRGDWQRILRGINRSFDQGLEKTQRAVNDRARQILLEFSVGLLTPEGFLAAMEELRKLEYWGEPVMSLPRVEALRELSELELKGEEAVEKARDMAEHLLKTIAFLEERAVKATAVSAAARIVPSLTKNSLVVLRPDMGEPPLRLRLFFSESREVRFVRLILVPNPLNLEQKIHAAVLQNERGETFQVDPKDIYPVSGVLQ